MIEPQVLRGVAGDNLTDDEVHELRRKNVNRVIDIDERAIAPMFDGTAGDGSSVLCTLWARLLLDELRFHEDVIRYDDTRQEITRAMRARGHDPGSEPEFELVLLEELDASPELLDVLKAETCISRRLCGMGLAVVEKRTKSPIAIQDSALV